MNLVLTILTRSNSSVLIMYFTVVGHWMLWSVILIMVKNVLLPTFVITSSIPVITLLFIIPWRIIYWMSTFICVRVGHFHAVLPSVFITPYSPYSIFFVLRVLFLKNHSKMTVAQITEQFQISVSTLYRWIAKYKVILRIFQQLKDRYQMHLFIHMM